MLKLYCAVRAALPPAIRFIARAFAQPEQAQPAQPQRRDEPPTRQVEFKVILNDQPQNCCVCLYEVTKGDDVRDMISHENERGPAHTFDLDCLAQALQSQYNENVDYQSEQQIANSLVFSLKCPECRAEATNAMEIARAASLNALRKNNLDVLATLFKMFDVCFESFNGEEALPLDLAKEAGRLGNLEVLNLLCFNQESDGLTVLKDTLAIYAFLGAQETKQAQVLNWLSEKVFPDIELKEDYKNMLSAFFLQKVKNDFVSLAKCCFSYKGITVEKCVEGLMQAVDANAPKTVKFFISESLLSHQEESKKKAYIEVALEKAKDRVKRYLESLS